MSELIEELERIQAIWNGDGYFVGDEMNEFLNKVSAALKERESERALIVNYIRNMSKCIDSLYPGKLSAFTLAEYIEKGRHLPTPPEDV